MALPASDLDPEDLTMLKDWLGDNLQTCAVSDNMHEQVAAFTDEYLEHAGSKTSLIHALETQLRGAPEQHPRDQGEKKDESFNTSKRSRRRRSNDSVKRKFTSRESTRSSTTEKSRKTSTDKKKRKESSSSSSSRSHKSRRKRRKKKDKYKGRRN